VKIWKVILATVVIFAAGMFAGVVAGRKTQPPPPPAAKEPIPPISSQQRFYGRLKKELQLTPEQTNRIDKIFAEGYEQVKLIWDLLNPELQKHRQEVYDKVRVALTPEQREKFEKLIKERPSMRKPDDGQRSRSPKQGTNSSGAKGPPPDGSPQVEAPAK